jgi:hypothetical protein
VGVLLKKVLLGMFFLMLVAAAAGCQPEPEEFDESALIAVNDYVDEMTTAMLDSTLEADLKGWVRDYYAEEDLPLRYDEERLQWLAEHGENLEQLYGRHRNSEFPADEEIADWQVVIVRGEKEWLLDGAEALGALEKLEALYGELLDVIAMIIESTGELSIEQSERVLELINDLEPRVYEIREVYFR